MVRCGFLEPEGLVELQYNPKIVHWSGFLVYIVVQQSSLLLCPGCQECGVICPGSGLVNLGLRLSCRFWC